MLLSRAGLLRLGAALSSGAMPLPRGVPNDEHIRVWAARLGVRCVHSNSLWYSILPADARILYNVGARLGRDLDEYVGANSPYGIRRRSEFATAAATETGGALAPQLMGVAVLHRVTPALMRALYAVLESSLPPHTTLATAIQDGCRK